MHRAHTRRSAMKVLLVEPAYRNKYPPLGLMKIASFHRGLGDEVQFVKGCDRGLAGKSWDRIYVTSLFSFYWSETIKTIRFYEFSTREPQGLIIGGPMATIMSAEIESETGYTVVRGLLNERGKLGLEGDESVDSASPDYSILEQTEYKYPASDAYFAYATRGCIRRCSFCAVPTLEPKFIGYLPILDQIRATDEKYGQKRDLLLLDNNILASSKFDKIIDEIQEAGFTKGAKLRGRNRHVDFNQGIDLRLLTREKMKRLAELPVLPLRLAFDHFALRDQYVQKVELAAEFGIKRISCYVLYNYRDTPDDFYARLKTNVELNRRLGTRVFSFPMRYVPIDRRDRTFVGEYWTARYLRGIQCILNATHGVVGPKKPFFKAAFGSSVSEFKKLLLMPDRYIIFRRKHRSNGAARWNKQYAALKPAQKNELHKILSNDLRRDMKQANPAVKRLLLHYHRRTEKHKSQLALF